MATASKKIQLANGKEVIVDAEDYDWLSQWKWHGTDWKNKAGYATTVFRTKQANGTLVRSVKMHRLIMGAKEGEEVDHINHNTYDNRRSNLRVCCRKENVRSRRMGRLNKSGYKGVIWHKNRLGKKNWSANIATDEGRKHLGRYYSAEEAARAYDVAAIKYHGEFAVTNGVGG